MPLKGIFSGRFGTTWQLRSRACIQGNMRRSRTSSGLSANVRCSTGKTVKAHSDPNDQEDDAEDQRDGSEDQEDDTEDQADDAEN